MPETVTVVRLGNGPKQIVDDAVQVLNEADSPFEFVNSRQTVVLPEPDLGPAYSWDLLTSILVQERSRLGTRYLFGVLDHPIESNWFSRTMHEYRVCFISTKDWSYHSQLPLVAYIAYEIVENLVEMLQGFIVFHEDTRGCVHDMCAFRPHISFKIRTADICIDCLNLLQTRLDPSSIAGVVAMIEQVRLVALGRATPPMERKRTLPDEVDQQFPFPIAYSFRSMQAELTPTASGSSSSELLRFVAPLAFYTLVKPVGGIQRRRGRSIFDAKHLMGSHPLFPIVRHSVQSKIDTDCLLYDPMTEQYLPLYPWIVLEPCSECHREMVFLFDGTSESAVIMREYPSEHKQRRVDLLEDVLRFVPGDR